MARTSGQMALITRVPAGQGWHYGYQPMPLLLGRRIMATAEVTAEDIDSTVSYAQPGALPGGAS